MNQNTFCYALIQLVHTLALGTAFDGTSEHIQYPEHDMCQTKA